MRCENSDRVAGETTLSNQLLSDCICAYRSLMFYIYNIKLKHTIGKLNIFKELFLNTTTIKKGEADAT